MNQLATFRMFKRLTGTEKSAILFLCLGKSHGAPLMQQLDEDEIGDITKSISAMGEVPAGLVEEVMREFGHKISSPGGIIGSVEAARGLLKEFLSEERVDEIFEGIEDGVGGDLWGELSELDEKMLADYLRKERNQTVSVILSRIRPDIAAKVLPLLGQERAADLVERMVAMEELPADVLRGIEDSLRREILAKAGRNTEAEAETKIVKVFNKLDDKVFAELSEQLEKSIPDKLRLIKAKMFVFGDLVELKPVSLARVMREVTGNTLPLALRGATKEEREHFLSALPARSRDMLQEEMDSMGPVRHRDVKQAQSDLVEAAVRLAENEEIEMPNNEEEEMIE